MVVAKVKPIQFQRLRRSNRKTRNRNYLISDNPTQLNDLPNEVLLKIFSYIPVKELFYNIRPVCKRYKDLAMSPILWKSIEVENEVPTTTLKQWIKSAKLLKYLSLRHRHDINSLAEEVSKCCKNLESIKLQNCWGSRSNYRLHSNPLCHLVTRCPKLSSYNFSQSRRFSSRFMSCKFFRLISKDDRHGSVMKKCNYTGPMTPKQMKALFSALEEYEVHETATIGNVNLNNRFKLRDIVRYVQNEPSPNRIINEVWENINYGGVNAREEENAADDFGMDVDI
ncbi:PREDICTED: uncharacterized F-box/LRR-repeat protein C02F5.7-like [Nicrophorus vespilloides]|uniref:Uncharacterized F-box/LRR-repeat protein C02F5.7-like n=1 Tax=Nicrophorus vespilloides TaxID=110193 RepID=A0ABM1M566_NICVS|nr:PREDICTED: uncharacterized F-box/LRR-repeat protein C02F5.7-like [Nicrophorus vespilloides]